MMSKRRIICALGNTSYPLEVRVSTYTVSVNEEEANLEGLQPHPGTQVHCYRCSLPGLAEFTAYCCGGTGATTASIQAIALECRALFQTSINSARLI